VIGQDILVDNVTINAGRQCGLHVQFPDPESAYSYSFFQTTGWIWPASIGLFVMPIKFE